MKIVLLKTGTSWVISMERDEFKDMLESFLLSSSTCFVKEALHSKDLNHKRFSKNGGQFLLFFTEFCFYQFSVGLVETRSFEGNFVKTYAMHRPEKC